MDYVLQELSCIVLLGSDAAAVTVALLPPFGVCGWLGWFEPNNVMHNVRCMDGDYYNNDI